MARFDLKFIDVTDSDNFIKAEFFETDAEGIEEIISITGMSDGDEFCIWLDKSTAIKFAKTLRTEINKIQ